MASSIYKKYWEAYGGISALVGSKYFWIAAIFSVLSPSLWDDKLWVAQSLQIFPNLLGFTLGGYALMLSVGGERFLLSLAGGRVLPGGYSKFVIFNASYVHFVVFQTLVLVLALLALNLSADCLRVVSKYIQILLDSYLFYCGDPRVVQFFLSRVFNFLGTWLMLYTILLLLPIVMNVFRFAINFDDFQRRQKKQIRDAAERKDFIEGQGYGRRKILEVRKSNFR